MPYWLGSGKLVGVSWLNQRKDEDKMNKYIIEYKNGERNTSVSVIDARNVTQITEIIESNYSMMMIFELEDGKNNTIALRTDSIIAIYSLGN